MNTGFHDPIKPKVDKSKFPSPWDYRAPSYDERTSCYMDAGTHWGVGYNQPVGHTGNPKERVPCLPFGRVNTMETDEVPRKKLNPEYLK